MNNLKNIIAQFSSLKGASFIGIKNYTNSKSEISNQVINTNISVLNAKQKDLKSLLMFDIAELKDMENFLIQDAENNKIVNPLLFDAYNELVTSEVRNTSNELELHTNASKGQIEAYINLGNGIKIHKDTLSVKLVGFAHSKEVLQKGVYKNSTKRQKTIFKDAIKSFLNFKMLKYRNFTFKDMDLLKIQGTEIAIS